MTLPNPRHGAGPAFSDESRPAWSHAGSSVPGPPIMTATSPVDLLTRFETRGEIGAGGMGRVKLVRDQWLGRLIAVKEPATEVDARRLWREALVTARLEHPGVVPIYDLGTGPDGAPWFAMRVVRGRSLAELLRERRGAPTDADPPTSLIRSLLAACEAVGYAHHEGVVHRDLKPANLMVGAFGEIQVIDWGLAQAADLPDADSGSVGTAAYMSPEQARAEPVDARSDVWSLGAILYEIVVGRPARQAIDSRSLIEVARAGAMPALPDDIAPDLRAVIAKAIAPRAADRYVNAKALAEDLGRYLEGRRVLAHSYRPVELLGRFARAWRIPLIILGASLAFVIVLLAVGVDRISDERDLAEANLATSLTREAQAALEEDRLLEAELYASQALASTTSSRLAARARGVLAAVTSARPRRVDAREVPCRPIDLSEGTTLCVVRGKALEIHPREGAPRAIDRAVEQAILIDHAGTVIANGGLDNKSLFALDAATGAVLWEREDPAHSALGSRYAPSQDGRTALHWNIFRAIRAGRDGVAMFPDKLCGEPGILTMDAREERLAMAACADGTIVRIHDGRVERIEVGLGTSEHPPLVTEIAIVGDESVVVGMADGVIELVTLGPVIERKLLGHQRSVIREITLGPDGRALALADGSPPLVLDLAARSIITRLPERDLGVGRFDRDGRVEVAATADEREHFEIARWDLGDATPRRLSFPDGVTTLAVSASGRWRAVGDGSKLRVIDRAGHVVATTRWQDSIVKTVAFDGDAFVIAHGLRASDVRAFAIQEDGDRVTLAPVDRYPAPAVIWRRLALLGDGTLVAASHAHEQYVLEPGRAWAKLSGARVLDLAASRDRSAVVMLEEGGRISCGFDFAARRTLTPCAEAPRAMAVSLDDRLVAALDPDGVDLIALGSDPSQNRVTRLDAQGAQLVSLAVSPTHVAAGSRDGSVRVWTRTADPTLSIVENHRGRVDGLAFDPDGHSLYAGGWDGHLSTLGLDDLVDRRELVRAALGPRGYEALIASDPGQR